MLTKHEQSGLSGSGTLAKNGKKENGSDSKLTFEAALDQLEQIVGDLEQGRLGLSESLSHYEQGVKHLKQCYEMLGAAEKKIELLSGVDADGNPITEPFEEEDGGSLVDKHDSRSRRRSRSLPADPGGDVANSTDEDSVDFPRGLF